MSANPQAVLELLDSLGITRDDIVAAVGGTQVATAPAKKARRVVGVAPENAGSPASYRQRKMVAGLSGVWPNEDTGLPVFTKADASRAINALLKGKTAKFGAVTLKPRA